MPARINRAFLPGLVTLLTFSLIAVACGSGESPSSSPSPDETLSVQIMNPLDLGVGPTRMPFFVSLFDQTRVDDRLSDMEFSYRQVDSEQFAPVPEVTWRQWPVSGGAYVVRVDFDHPGIWEFQVKLGDGDDEKIGSTFAQVKASSSAPAVGDAAPSVSTKTASTVEEIEQISSAFDPDLDFYSISLNEALTSGKPTVVLFSTPAYCNTATCGPQLETLGVIKDRHRDEVNFIHVEIWDNIREMLDTGDQSIGEIAGPVDAWGLISEPWTFFIGADGVIADRMEQFATEAELEAALQRLLN